jgi:predicted kinase
VQRLFVVAGPAASGKTFFTQELAKKYPLKILELDDRLDELIDTRRARVEEIGMESFLKEIRAFRYDDLVQRAVGVLRSGESVAIVAPFTQQIRDLTLWASYTEPFLELAVTPLLICISVSPETRTKRIMGRGELRDGEKVASKEKMSAYLAESERLQTTLPHIEIDGAGDFREQIKYNL